MQQSTPPQITGVHGVLSQSQTASEQAKRWFSALDTGLNAAGYSGDYGLSTAYYADLLLPKENKGRRMALTSLASQTLTSLWGETKTREAELNDWIQRIYQSGYSKELGDFLLKTFANQAWRYLYHDDTRAAVQARLAACIGAKTRVVVAHSLGSVACYEYLLSHPEHRVELLITFGSPLGLKGLVYENVQDWREKNGYDLWPNVQSWINVAFSNDFVAAPCELGALYDRRIRDIILPSTENAHQVERYLSSTLAVSALAQWLSQSRAHSSPSSALEQTLKPAPETRLEPRR